MRYDVQATDTFRRSLGKLPPPLRGRVQGAIRKLQQEPWPRGLNVEPVQGASAGVRSCRVNREARVIFKLAGPTLTLLHVGRHDPAYRKGVMYLITEPGVNLGTLDDEEASVFEEFGAHPEAVIYRDLRELPPDWELPREAIEAAASVITGTVVEGTDRRADPDYHSAHGAGVINVIPSDQTGPCTDVLVGFIFDKDNFGERLRQIAYHAGIHCPQTRLVVVVTSQWNPREWKNGHEEAFNDLRARVLVYFAGFESLTRIA